MITFGVMMRVAESFRLVVGVTASKIFTTIHTRNGEYTQSTVNQDRNHEVGKPVLLTPDIPSLDAIGREDCPISWPVVVANPKRSVGRRSAAGH